MRSGAAAGLVTGRGLSCPVCSSDQGALVRAGILDERAPEHLLATLAPFPVLGMLVLALALAPRWRRAGRP